MIHHFKAAPCVILIALVQDAYLDVRPLDWEQGHIRVHVRVGQAIIVRGDCVHRGVENLGDRYTIRLHAYCRPANWLPLLEPDGGNKTFYADVEFEGNVGSDL